MALLALGQRTIVTAAAGATWEIRAGAANKPKVLQMEFSQVTAVAATMGIGRPALIGVTPTTPQTYVDESDGNGAVGVTTSAVAWGTGPTVPANFNRRYTMAATVGVGQCVVFPGGLGIPVLSGTVGSLVLWVIATAPVLDANAVVSE